MKVLIVLCDGMADLPIPSLGGRTPLQTARTPAMDRLARQGRVGLVRTVPEHMAPGSDVANLSVLGYDPARYYTGRSSLEALARGIDLGPGDVSWRANLVTLEGDGPFEDCVLTDFSGGEISDDLARPLLQAAAPLMVGFELCQGISYRNLLIARAGQTGTVATPPHDIQGRAIGPYLPGGTHGETFTRYMRQSYDLLRAHPLVKSGAAKANCLWFWGEGTAPRLPDFRSLRGLRGGVVCAVDLLKGIGRAAGMTVSVPPTATGGMVTDYAAKAEAARALFDRGCELVFLHIEAPDECGHHGDPAAKVRAIEAIDRDILDPLSRALAASGEPCRVLVLPDHPTPCAIRTHTADPVPFLLWDSESSAVGELPFTEDAAAHSTLRLASGPALMDLLLK